MIIRKGEFPPIPQRVKAMIGHQHWQARKLQHFDVIEIIANRHHLLGPDFTGFCPIGSATPFEQPRFITSSSERLRDRYFVQVRLQNEETGEPRSTVSTGSILSGGPPNVT